MKIKKISHLSAIIIAFLSLILILKGCQLQYTPSFKTSVDTVKVNSNKGLQPITNGLTF